MQRKLTKGKERNAEKKKKKGKSGPLGKASV